MGIVAAVASKGSGVDATGRLRSTSATWSSRSVRSASRSAKSWAATGAAVGVEATELLEEGGAADERRAHHVVGEEGLSPEPGGLQVAVLVLVVDVVAVLVAVGGVRAVLERGHEVAQRVRGEEVAGAEHDDELAVGGLHPGVGELLVGAARRHDHDGGVAAHRVRADDDHLGAVVDLGVEGGERRVGLAVGRKDDRRDDGVDLQVGEGRGPRAQLGGAGPGVGVVLAVAAGGVRRDRPTTTAEPRDAPSVSLPLHRRRSEPGGAKRAKTLDIILATMTDRLSAIPWTWTRQSYDSRRASASWRRSRWFSAAAPRGTSPPRAASRRGARRTGA